MNCSGISATNSGTAGGRWTASGEPESRAPQATETVPYRPRLARPYASGRMPGATLSAERLLAIAARTEPRNAENPHASFRRTDRESTSGQELRPLVPRAPCPADRSGPRRRARCRLEEPLRNGLVGCEERAGQIAYAGHSQHFFGSIGRQRCPRPVLSDERPAREPELGCQERGRESESRSDLIEHARRQSATNPSQNLRYRSFGEHKSRLHTKPRLSQMAHWNEPYAQYTETLKRAQNERLAIRVPPRQAGQTEARGGLCS